MSTFSIYTSNFMEKRMRQCHGDHKTNRRKLGEQTWMETLAYVWRKTLKTVDSLWAYILLSLSSAAYFVWFTYTSTEVCTQTNKFVKRCLKAIPHWQGKRARKIIVKKSKNVCLLTVTRNNYSTETDYCKNKKALIVHCCWQMPRWSWFVI